MAEECCNTNEKDRKDKTVVNQPENIEIDNHRADDGHNHDTGGEDEAGWKAYWDLFITGIIYSHCTAGIGIWV